MKTPFIEVQDVVFVKGFVYHISTYTGDKKGAGTDANVVITVFGEEGDSGEHTLNNSRNNFERGK